MTVCNQEHSSLAKFDNVTVAEMILLASSVSFLLYVVYFLLAPFIWQQNLIVPPEELTPIMRGWNIERDGVEVYALYALMFANVLLSVLVLTFYLRVSGTITRQLLMVVLLAASGFYYFSIGFNPPVSSNSLLSILSLDRPVYAVLTLVILAVTLLYCLQRYAGKLLPWLVALLLIPVCFIATDPANWVDGGFIFLPALRILSGARLSDIYFQYDLFFSLLAAAWLKLNISLYYFQVVGQCSFYALILGAYLFSRKYFLNKNLPVFLLISLVLYKIYAMSLDPTALFQVTPLRLDLWLPLLILVYVWGPFHWSTGLFFGFMLIFHKNFGIIYFASYCQLLLTLFLLDHFGAGASPEQGGPRFVGEVKSLLKACWLNLSIAAAACAVSLILYHNSLSGYARLYQKLGLGFMKISSTSFYWYVPVLIGAVVMLLLKHRQTLSRSYLTTGFLLTYLAIGNSIYFFGRSHENNIINISASLLMLFYLLLDLIAYDRAVTVTARHGRFVGDTFTALLSTLFILLIVVCYGDNIVRKLDSQCQSMRTHRTLPEVSEAELVTQYNVRKNIQAVRTATGNSKKVYFVSMEDFKYYYYGNYSPVGYINPVISWIFNKDFASFLQNLVNDGYYLVIDQLSYPLIAEVLQRIPYTRQLDKDGLLILWKE